MGNALLSIILVCLYATGVWRVTTFFSKLTDEMKTDTKEAGTEPSFTDNQTTKNETTKLTTILPEGEKN